MKRTQEIAGLARAVEIAALEGCFERVEELADRILKRARNETWIDGALTYPQLNEACVAFLKEVGMPTLAVTATYLKHYQRAAETHSEAMRLLRQALPFVQGEGWPQDLHDEIDGLLRRAMGE